MIYRRHPQTAGRIIDGVAFIVTADDNKLHTLNSTATKLWELAGEGCTTEQAAAVLVRHYRVDEDRALRDVDACLRDMQERMILVAEP